MTTLGRRALLLCCALGAGPWLIPTTAPGQTGDRLISDQEAARYGLRRAWYTHAAIDPASGRIAQLTLSDDLLLVLSDQAILHAIDAQSGATRWTTQVGNPNFASLGPAGNDRYIALINGSTLYMLDRITGTLLWQESLGGGPGGGPALSDTYVFAPLISGVLKGFAFELREGSRPVWAYPSAGRAVTQPVTSERSVFWPTDRGHLYVADANSPAVRFRLETHDEIIAKPGYRRPMIYTGSLDGYIYAVHEMTGAQEWRFSVGNPIVVSPAAVEDHVFVCSQAPRMHCLSAEDGTELWNAPHVERFVAASPDRVYGMDRWSHLYILDRATGELLGRINFRNATVPLVNEETDRLYLATPTGLIQCLHESAIAEPIYYRPPPLPENLDAAAETQPDAAAAAPPDAAAAPATDDPFAGGTTQPPAEDDPFATPDDAADDDPFNF